MGKHVSMGKIKDEKFLTFSKKKKSENLKQMETETKNIYAVYQSRSVTTFMRITIRDQVTPKCHDQKKIEPRLLESLAKFSNILG